MVIPIRTRPFKLRAKRIRLGGLVNLSLLTWVRRADKLFFFFISACPPKQETLACVAKSASSQRPSPSAQNHSLCPLFNPTTTTSIRRAPHFLQPLRRNITIGGSEIRTKRSTSFPWNIRSVLPSLPDSFSLNLPKHLGHSTGNVG